MGKRKHKDKSQRKRRNKRPRYYSSGSDSSSTQDEHYEDRRHKYYQPDLEHAHTSSQPYNRLENEYDMPLSDSEASIEGANVDSFPVETSHNDVTPSKATRTTEDLTHISNFDPRVDEPGPSNSVVEKPLSAEILEALGDPKGKEEVFGPKIPEEIAIRWGRVIVDGLSKEQKQELMEKSLVPDNFRLIKAPLLNPELVPVLSEPARARDKVLEKSQNQLGMGISRLTLLATMVIEGNTEKIELLRQISEISQIFLDSHHEDTKRRRKLVASSLDKRFINIINNIKRDNYLFGENLGEKIKASKSAERSGLQIKRNDASLTATRKNPQQGNWRGPPRSTVHRPYKQGGQRGRHTAQQNRRPPQQAPDRHPRAPAKQSSKSFKTQ